MNKINKLIIYSVFGIVFVLFLRYILTTHTTGNISTAASPTPVQRAISCSAEISNLFQKNDKSLVKFQVQNSELVYGGQRYNTAVFDCPDESQSYLKVFLLSQSDNSGKEKILFSMEDEMFDKSEIRDINKDGLAELIVSHSNSGNCWLCGGSSVFQIDKVNGAVKDLLKDLPKPEGSSYANVAVSDLNNDGIDEVLLINNSWELSDGFNHANSPRNIEILSWSDGEYQYDGASFPKFYLNQISERDKDREKLLKSKDTQLSDIVKLAIENFNDNLEMGKTDEAYANFILETNIETLPKTITVSDTDKIWLLGIRNQIEEEYKANRPTIRPLY